MRRLTWIVALLATAAAAQQDAPEQPPVTPPAAPADATATAQDEAKPLAPPAADSKAADTPAAEAAAVEAPPKPALIVLDVEAKGVSALEAEAATQAVVLGLRELDTFQVLSSTDVRQLLAIERTRQLLGSAEGPGGLKDLSEVLGAQQAVAGTMARVGDRLQVEIRLLDNRQAKVIGQRALEPVRTIEEVALRLPELAQVLVGPLLEAQRGALIVQSNEEAAEVVVDDMLVATTPMRTSVKLPRGSHRVLVRKDGFIAQARSVTILPEQSKLEQFTLVPSADYAEAYALRHGRIRTAAWIAAGGAVVSLAGAVMLDRFATQPLYDNEFRPRQYALAGVTALPDDVAQSTERMARYSQCGADLAACEVQLQSLQGQILAAQAGTISLAVLGIGAGVTATYLFLTGKDPNRYANLVASVLPAPGGAALVLAGRF